ncbi:MAG TPA: hypothetical protein VNR65_04480, partial [Geobacterales bacterium]|nr:hypothetical protein [Geobacterales bacterium]
AGIGCLPDTAADGAEIKRSSITRYTGDGNHTAAAKWANHSPLQAAKEIGRNRLGAGGKVQGKNNQKKEQQLI